MLCQIQIKQYQNNFMLFELSEALLGSEPFRLAKHTHTHRVSPAGYFFASPPLLLKFRLIESTKQSGIVHVMCV